MLRFPLAVLVVFIHAFGPALDVEQLHAGGLSGMAVFGYLRILISAVIARSAVPLFFLFSGFLFFWGVEQFDRTVYAEKLRKRWHSLARPYLIWNILAALWMVVIKMGGILLHGKPWSGIGDYFAQQGYLHMLWDCGVWDERTTWLGTTIRDSGPELGPFWFVRNLMVLAVLTPVLYWLIRRLRLGFVLMVVALYVTDIRASWFCDSTASALCFFSLGAYFSIMKQDFTEVLWRWRYVIIPLAVVLTVVRTLTWGDLDDCFSQMVRLWHILLQTLAFIIVASALCRYRWLYEWCSRLAPSSFFIYASHMFIIRYVSDVVTKLTPMSDLWYMQCIDYLISPLACVALCVAVYNAGRRWMPSAMKLLMGERS